MPFSLHPLSMIALLIAPLSLGACTKQGATGSETVKSTAATATAAAPATAAEPATAATATAAAPATVAAPATGTGPATGAARAPAPDKTAAPVTGRVRKDTARQSCTKSCVRANQMQARAPQDIEANCKSDCDKDPRSWPK